MKAVNNCLWFWMACCKVRCKFPTKIGCGTRFALSPAMGDDFAPAQLWEWMKADGLFDVVMNVQLHRIIGLP